ncbi:MAG: type VI secretion system baseplate subunit TssF [Acidobacteriia bacterium]|nr:type VI secretion system baseplate subunit TssF [Terriglobia bacterium]
MKQDLLPYYENELSFIRHLAQEFAGSYGKVAGRLLIEPGTGKSEDPHIERLIEAFALIAGRIHHKIDDEFPEITESLLNVLYPHYLRPIPSMSIAQFRVDPEQALLSSGHVVARGTALYTRPIAGKATACSFRTCYPVTLWPIQVTSAALLQAGGIAEGSVSDRAAAVIRIELKCIGGGRMSALKLDRLRFCLHGEPRIIHTLYELLFHNVIRATIRGPGAGIVAFADLPEDSVQAVGFGREEGLLPYPDRSFLGYRLIQEYFSFPAKYLFFDLCGFDRLERTRFGETFQILLHLSQFERKERLQELEQNVNRETFQLGCTPIINLFERLAEPIRLTHAKTEYRIVPDVHRQATTEVYSVDRVTSTVPYLERPVIYEPFYSTRHVYSQNSGQAYWYASRRLSERKGDKGTEVYLSFVNPGFDPCLPPEETVTVHITSTNRDLAGELPPSFNFGDLSLEAGSLVRARLLLSPTKPVRPPLRRALQWRLISHLALNHLSIADSGCEALQEILKLYDFSDDQTIQRQIAGILAVSSRPHLARMVSEHGVVFAQGLKVDLEFDEDAFVGIGVFLFAAVLERFLGLYTAINSFTQLTARTNQRRGVLNQWPPRSGEQILL